MKKIQTAGSLLRYAQNSIEQKLTSSAQDDVHLTQSSFWARSVTWTLIATTAFGIGWLCLAKTEEIVVATGKLEPVGQVKDIQMPVGGIAKTILVRNGDTVKAGDVLMRLDAESTLDRQHSLRRTISLKKKELALKYNELARYMDLNRSEQEVLGRNLGLNREMMNRYQTLAKEGATAEMQYLQQKNKVEEVKGQLDQSRIERLRQQAILLQSTQQLEAEISKLSNELVELNVNIRYQTIKSPVNGVVFDLKPTTPGFVAQTSEPIMKIVPFDQLMARVTIPSDQIGFVSVGKIADISIDSFPATDFGVIQGKVVKIASDALPPNEQDKTYRFPADIKLSSQQLKLKSGNILPLQAGMSLKANIKLRKVSYLQMLLGSFQDKADSIRRLR